MYRKYLERNTTIVINNKEYKIKYLLGRGGTSLVYQAEDAYGEHPWIIKEFFPGNQIAYREADGRVVACDGKKSVFEQMKDRFFTKEAALGNCLGIVSHQVYAFDEVDSTTGFAKMRKFSEDTISIYELVKRWEANKILMNTHTEYNDMDWCKYVLHQVAGLLLLLEEMHNRGVLHLDLSPSNIALAGLDKDKEGIYSSILIFDFGCSVRMGKDRRYIKENPRFLSYTQGFGAPETKDTQEIALTVKADLYAVSALLLFMLCSASVVNEYWMMWDDLWKRFRYIEDCIDDLNVPGEFKRKLFALIKGTCARKPEDRMFSTAQEMFEVVQKLEKEFINYKIAHLYLPEVKPVSPFFVRHSDELMTQIESALQVEQVVYICGMSGSGKSEMLRQFASERCQNIPVLEIYFPEDSRKYTMDDVVSSLTYINLGDEDRKDIFYRFLEKEVVLLLHNFNSPQLTIIQELKRKNVKILVSSQCTREQLEYKNVLPESVMELKPTAEFCVRIIQKVFDSYKKATPIQNEELYVLSGLLFNIPILVNLVASQMVYMSKEDFHWLIDELKKARIDDVYKQIPLEVEYIKENGKELRGTPYDIVCNIIRKILPPLTEMEKQCLQVMTKMESVWVDAIDLAQSLGDLPNMRCKEAHKAIQKLIDTHILQEKQVEENRYVSIHALMAIVVSSKGNDENDLGDSPLEFWQHIEKNRYASSFVKNGKGFQEDRNTSEHFILHLLKARMTGVTNLRVLFDKIKDWYGKTGLYISTPKHISEIWDNEDYWSNKINNVQEMTYIGRFSYQFICKDGIEVYASRILSEPLPVLLAGEQLKEENRYFNHKDKSNQRGERIECYLHMYITAVTKQEEFKLPTEIQGVPVTSCNLDIHGDSLEVLNDEGKRITFSEIILPESYRYFSGKNIGNVGFVKKVVLNSGLEYFGGFHSSYFDRWEYLSYERNPIEEIVISSSVKEIKENAFDKYINKVTVDPENPYFVEVEGAIYTSDYKRLLFVPREQIDWEFNVLPATRYIDFLCWGILPEDIILKNMSYDAIEKVKKHVENFTKLQWGLFLAANHCENKKDFLEMIEIVGKEAYHKEKRDKDLREQIFNSSENDHQGTKNEAFDFDCAMFLVEKRDKKIVSMYENGMTSEEIRFQMRTIDGVEMSTVVINTIIEKTKIKKILGYDI